MVKPYPLEPLVTRLLSPLESFLRATTSGGLVLIAATVVALLTASIFGGDAVHAFWEHEISLEISNFMRIHLTAHQVVNDALMAIFFLLVGLELKRELIIGELSRPREAMLPVVAAIGGMIGPALIYLAFNRNPETMSGWGIPMATDIAFAIGVLVLLADRIPRGLLVFLTALAIADDLGAVLIIAFFYTSSLDMHALVIASWLYIGLLILNAAGIRAVIPYAVIGAALWLAMLHSGVHATIAGILLASAIPARPARNAQSFAKEVGSLHQEMEKNSQNSEHQEDIARQIALCAHKAQSPLHRIEAGLARWVTFGILPIFALANAGIDLTAISWAEALTAPVTLGVFFGLVFGKVLGVGLASMFATGTKMARLPASVTWPHLWGAGWLAGIGFTMSLFIAQLAFRDPQLIEEAKLGILLGSLVSAVIGLLWLVIGPRKPATSETLSTQH